MEEIRNNHFLKQGQRGTEAPAYLCISGSLLVFLTTPDTWYSSKVMDIEHPTNVEDFSVVRH